MKVNLPKRLSIGLYFLYDEDKTIMYVGKSTYLKQRIKQQIITQKPTYIRIMQTSVADLDILEAYYIQKLKPYNNVELKSDEKTSIEINHNYELSDYIEVVYDKEETNNTIDEFILSSVVRNCLNGYLHSTSQKTISINDALEVVENSIKDYIKIYNSRVRTTQSL